MSLAPATPNEIERSEVDGVPIVHLPAPGRTTIGLTFRVGRADEPIAWAGVTHLVEHLILHPFELDDDNNGFTSPYFVTFIHRGTPAGCADFVARVCGSIARLPIERISLEVPVLRVEPGHRSITGGSSGGLTLPLALNRYGLTGLGAAILPEYFLRRPDPDVARDWAATRLVAANAAIWIAGSMPDNLTVPLERGTRHAVPVPEEITGLVTPTVTRGDSQAVAASFVSSRSAALSSGMAVLERRLLRSLRIERGSAYAVNDERILLGANRQHASLWLSALPNAAPGVATALIDEIDRMARIGPTPQELQHVVERALEAFEDPLAAMQLLGLRAEEELLGDAGTEVQAVQEEFRELTPERIAAAIAEARSSLLMLVPEPERVPRQGFHPYPGPPDIDPRAGRARTFTVAGTRPAPPFRPATTFRLAIGPQGAWISAPEDRRWTDTAPGARVAAIPWSECVGVVHEPGSREILARDGSTLSVNRNWADTDRAIRAVDEHAPPGLVIPAAPWSVAEPRPPARWVHVRRSLAVFGVGAWCTVMWALANPPAAEQMLLVGLALSGIVTMLGTAWLERD